MQRETARTTTLRPGRLSACHLIKSLEQASQTSRSRLLPRAKFGPICSLNRKLRKASNGCLRDRLTSFHESPHPKLIDLGFEQNSTPLTQTSYPFWLSFPSDKFGWWGKIFPGQETTQFYCPACSGFFRMTTAVPMVLVKYYGYIVHETRIGRSCNISQCPTT